MRVVTGALAERARGSLFLVPTAFVAGGAVLALAGLVLDERVGDDLDPPVVLVTTVDSARAVLSTVASATMAFAGIAFSVALLVFQMSSSQYSPRVVHNLFRDGFNKRVIGIVVGTFTYCLVVLRSVHDSVEEGPGAVIPVLSVSFAVVLGIVAVLAVVAFIDHNAHRMDVSQILQDVTLATKDRVRGSWEVRQDETAPATAPPARAPSGAPWQVTASGDGWVQRVDEAAILAVVPPGATAFLATGPGRYVVAGAPLCELPAPAEDEERVASRIRRAVVLGDSRTMTQDPAYGLRQLVDVALKALSPGVNDPTTAQDAIFHIAAVLHEMLQRRPPPQVTEGDEGRRLVASALPSHEDLLELGFAELRRSAAPHPTVVEYVLEALRILDAGVTGDDPEAERLRGAVRRHAALVVASAERADLDPWDAARVRAAHRERFGALADGGGNHGELGAATPSTSR